MVTYREKKSNTVIEVLNAGIAGKRPSLFVGRGHVTQKVASFSSDESAKKFCDILDEFLRLEDKK